MLAFNVHAAPVKLGDLPLGSASSTVSDDSFPYTDSVTITTKRLRFSDMINIPSLVANYAALASPTFTGTVTAPTFVGALTGAASGNLSITPNQYGVIVSGAAQVATVVAPVASTVFPLISGGTGAAPAWGALGPTAGGTGLTTYTTGDLPYASASNVLSKLPKGTSGKAFVQGASIPSWTTLGESGGGTNQSTYVAGDIVAATATNTLGVITAGAAGTVLTGNGAGAAATFQSQSGAPYNIKNCSIAATVAASALTIAIKDASGANPSVGSPCVVSFRNATGATGTYADVSLTAALSLTVTNGTSLGCIALSFCTIYVYVSDNVGTMVLSIINGNEIDEGTTQAHTSCCGTAIGTLYSSISATRSVRELGRVTIAPAAAFAWTNAAAEISNTPFRTQYITPWVSWTPTGTWVANTTYTGRKRRVGNMGEYEVYIALGGAPTSASLTVTQPAGEVFDIATPGGLLNTIAQAIGDVYINDNGVASYTGVATYATTTTVGVNALVASGTYVGPTSVTQAVPTTFGNLDAVAVKWKAPIVGWSP